MIKIEEYNSVHFPLYIHVNVKVKYNIVHIIILSFFLTSIFSSSSWRNSPSPLTLDTDPQLLAHITALDMYSNLLESANPTLRERERGRGEKKKER